jgi:hypothetical protein
MKVLQITRLRDSGHDQMREGLENFGKHGIPGVEAMWFSADARTVVVLYEINDPTDLHKYGTFYAPYIEHIETHLVTDATAGVANMQAGLDLAQ